MLVSLAKCMVQGSFWIVTVLVKAGPDCKPWGWPLKVNMQSNKRTNVLVYVNKYELKIKVVHYFFFSFNFTTAICQILFI